MSEFAVAFGHEVDLSDKSDAELLEGVVWLPSASEELRRSAESGRTDKFWRAWSKQMAARADRRLQRKRAANRGGLWPWNAASQHPAKSVWTLIEKEGWPRLGRWASQQLAATESWKDERTELELLALADWLWSGPRVDATDRKSVV